MKKGVFTGLCCSALVLCVMIFSSGAQEETQGTSVFFPEPAYTFDAVFEGASVPHDFVIQNKGPGALDVKRVEGG